MVCDFPPHSWASLGKFWLGLPEQEQRPTISDPGNQKPVDNEAGSIKLLPAISDYIWIYLACVRMIQNCPDIWRRLITYLVDIYWHLIMHVFSCLTLPFFWYGLIKRSGAAETIDKLGHQEPGNKKAGLVKLHPAFVRMIQRERESMDEHGIIW